MAGLPVDVRLGVTATAELVAGLAPDGVVVATGGRVVLPDLPGADLPHVQRSGDLDVSAGPAAVGQLVAVLGGTLAGLELAELLATQGRRVAVFEPGETVAPEIGWKRKTEHLMRLDRLGVTLHTEVVVEAILPEGVAFTPADGTRRVHPADTVLLTGTVEPDTSLRDEIAAQLQGLEVLAAGDCTGLGLIQKAVEDGARAGAVL